jgi:hypothetical protein
VRERAMMMFEMGHALDMASALELASNPANIPPGDDNDGTF